MDCPRPAARGRRHRRPRGQHLGPHRATQLGRHRWSGHLHLLHLDPGTQAAHPFQGGRQVGRPRAAADTDDARAVGAQGHGQRGPLGAATHDVLAAPQDAGRVAGLVGPGSGEPGHRAVPLAPEGTPVGQRGGRPAARAAPAGIGLHVGRLDPGRLQREGPVAFGDRHRGGQRHRAVASLHPTGGGPGRPQVRGERGVGAELDRGPRRRRRRRRTRRRPTPRRRPSVWKAGPSSWARQAASNGSRAGAGVPGASADPSAGPRARSAASRMDCHPVQRHRWASSAPSTSRRDAGRPGPAASSAARRITMPGVQNPHWLAPVATKASAQRSRCAAGSPSIVVTSRPATRRTGVTQATRGSPSTQTVQQPH